MTLSRHYSLNSLLEALLAASVDAENDFEKHASMSSLSSGSRDSDYDGYFYIWFSHLKWSKSLLWVFTVSKKYFTPLVVIIIDTFYEKENR